MRWYTAPWLVGHDRNSIGRRHCLNSDFLPILIPRMGLPPIFPPHFLSRHLQQKSCTHHGDKASPIQPPPTTTSSLALQWTFLKYYIPTIFVDRWTKRSTGETTFKPGHLRGQNYRHSRRKNKIIHQKIEAA